MTTQTRDEPTVKEHPMSDDITTVRAAEPAADTRRPDFADWIDGQQTPGMAIPAIAAPTLDLVERAFEAGRGAGMKARPLDDAASELLNEAGERLRHLAAQHSAIVQAAVADRGPNDDVARRVATDAKHDRALANKIGRFLLQPVPGEQPTTGLLRRAFQAGSDYAKAVAEPQPFAEHDAIREARDDNAWAVQTGWTAAIAAVLGLVTDMRRIWPNLIPPAVFLDRIGSLTPPEDLDEAFAPGRAIDARRQALEDGLRSALGVIDYACEREDGLKIMTTHLHTIAGLCALMGEDVTVSVPEPDAGDALRVAALEGGLRQALAFIWIVQDNRDASAVLTERRIDEVDALGRLLDGDSYTRRKITPLTREAWLQDLERNDREALRMREEAAATGEAVDAVKAASIPGTLASTPQISVDDNGVITGMTIDGQAQQFRIYADAFRVVQPGEPPMPPSEVITTLDAAADGATGNSRPFVMTAAPDTLIPSKISLDIDAVPEVTIVDSEQRVVMTVKDGEVLMTEVGVKRLSVGALPDVKYNAGTPIADLKPGEPPVVALSADGPNFDPGRPLTVNGYAFVPSAKVSRALEFTLSMADMTEDTINAMIERYRHERKCTGETAKIAWLILDELQTKAARAVPEYNQ